ncbi:MAG: hypothetical protein ACPIB0_04435, partial [Akkermansiaceae bacterium]
MMKQLRKILSAALGCALLSGIVMAEQKTSNAPEAAESSAWEGRRSTFHGYELVDFKLGEVPCKVVIPK